MSIRSTRDRILEVTRDMLQRQGSAGDITVGAVAAAAHISRATLYRYFPDKATLLRAAGIANAGSPGGATPRERILQATLEVIGERGVHAATMEEIAGRAGLSRSGLHWHYKNKEELVADLTLYIPLLPVFAEEAMEAAQPGADLETQLRRIVVVLLEQAQKLRGILRVILFEAAIYPDVAHLANTYSVGRGLPLLIRIFEQHERNGTLRPGSAQARAQAFVGMFMSLLLLRSAFGALLAPDDRETAREYVDILLHGILAPTQEE